MAEELCPQCGVKRAEDSPAQLCAACLLRRGLETPGGAGSMDGMPTPEELTAILPDLTVIECVGAGGMGAVYRARQEQLDRDVAVKILAPDVADSAEFLARFNREARALAALSHPNIVSVYDFGQAEGVAFIVMEFIEGTNLRQVIQGGALTPAEALSIVPKLCETLQYAHDHGVVHRDIKPENVLVSTSGAIKVVDFGLAKSVQPGSDVTVTARVMGTPAYMAPEQLERPETVDHRADLYSMGVVFYELLTGELPIGRFVVPSEKVQIDVRLDEVVMRTLEKERERRYQRAGDVKTDIDAVNAGEEPSVAPTTPLTPAAAFAQVALRVILILGGCGLLLVVGVFLISTISAIAIPNLLNAVDRGKQVRSVYDIRKIAAAAESYRENYGSYPEVSNLSELRTLLALPVEEELPQLDGWAREFIVESDGDRFTVGSGGKDGGKLTIEGGGGARQSFDDAIIATNGMLVQWPQGRGEADSAAREANPGGGPVGVSFLGIIFIGLLGSILMIGLIVLIFFWRRRARRAERS